MKLFVWDYHGVMERGNEYALFELTNTVLFEQGYAERFTQEDCNRLYGRKFLELFADMLPNEDSEVHNRLVKLCLAHPLTWKLIEKHIRKNDHLEEVLSKIAQKHAQIVISNADRASLDKFIAVIGVEKYFPRNDSFSTINGNNVTTKKAILKKYLRNRRFEDIVVIGDTPDDVALTSVAGGTSYLYTRPGLPFKDCNADRRIRNLREVLKEI